MSELRDEFLSEEDLDLRNLTHDELIAYSGCSVFLALIGPRWLKARSGLRRRLKQAMDLVRLEIFVALSRPILVIPVLVDGAKLPPAKALPGSIVDLVSRSAVSISEHGIREEIAALAAKVRRGIEAHPPLAGDALQAERQRVRNLIATEQEGRRRRWLKAAGVSMAAVVIIAGFTIRAIRRFVIGVDMPCIWSPLRHSVQVNGPNYGPDRKAPLDPSQAFTSAIPAGGKMTINLASGTSVENAFVVDSSDLSAQVRVGGNNWRGLSPMTIENKSVVVMEVVISSWFKRPPSDAATPWSQSKMKLDASGHLIGDDGLRRNTAPDLEGAVRCHSR